MKAYESLGFYHPTQWKAWVVGTALTRRTRENGLIPFCDPRHRYQTKAPWCRPELAAYVRKRTVRNPRAAGWHQDGDLTGEEMDFYLVLWTTVTPTEIRTMDGAVHRPLPYEVALINNKEVEHRRPAIAPRKRWMFRQIVRME